MLKAVGSLLLLCGCVGAGALPVRVMDKRIGTIRSLLCALEILERELSFCMPLLEEILSTAARSTQGPTQRFLSVCRNELGKNLEKPFAEIWSRAAHEQLTSLKKSDLDLLCTLGGVLGKYDCDGQRQAIGQTRCYLERLLSDAETERQRQGKVYRVLGAAVGSFLVIVLL